MRTCAICTERKTEKACVNEPGCGWAPLHIKTGICVSGVPDIPSIKIEHGIWKWRNKTIECKGICIWKRRSLNGGQGIAFHYHQDLQDLNLHTHEINTLVVKYNMKAISPPLMAPYDFDHIHYSVIKKIEPIMIYPEGHPKHTIAVDQARLYCTLLYY